MAFRFARFSVRSFATTPVINSSSCFQSQLEGAVVNATSSPASSSTISATHDDKPSFSQQLWKTLKHGVFQAENDRHFNVTPEIIAEGVTRYYGSLTAPENKMKFFDFLIRDLGPDHRGIANVSKQLCDVHNENRDVMSLLRVEGTLRSALRPAYLELFALMPRMSNGLETLITLRADLLSAIGDIQHGPTPDGEPSLTFLRELDTHLKSVLTQWFSLGFLDLQRITWDSPCDIMEKVSDYEAVHSVKHWKDIKHRVGPYRRVFVFTHRGMPREPLMILHTALTASPSDSVQALLKLDDGDSVEKSENIRTAVFYSISATHKGLSGIELGNLLILQVVNELKKEFPWLDDFVTLSPIPGFRKWLESHLRQNIVEVTDSCKISEGELSNMVAVVGRHEKESNLETLQRVLADNSWTSDPNFSRALKQPLLTLCSRYLVEEKRRKLAYNPVTHFHIRNGASIWRLNWLADVSPRGVNQSYGMMTNYRYIISEMVDNNISYSTVGKIKHSDFISPYLSS